jgi:hypothetical protein
MKRLQFFLVFISIYSSSHICIGQNFQLSDLKAIALQSPPLQKRTLTNKGYTESNVFTSFFNKENAIPRSISIGKQQTIFYYISEKSVVKLMEEAERNGYKYQKEYKNGSGTVFYVYEDNKMEIQFCLEGKCIIFFNENQH